MPLRLFFLTIINHVKYCWSYISNFCIEVNTNCVFFKLLLLSPFSPFPLSVHSSAPHLICLSFIDSFTLLPLGMLPITCRISNPPWPDRLPDLYCLETVDWQGICLGRKWGEVEGTSCVGFVERVYWSSNVIAWVLITFYQNFLNFNVIITSNMSGLIYTLYYAVIRHFFNERKKQ